MPDKANASLSEDASNAGVSVSPPVLDLRQGNMRWPLRIKILRGTWNICELLFFRPTPRRLGNAWRLWLLRRFGAVIRGSALIMPSCRILQPWNLEVHDGAAIGDAVEIYNYGRVTIGEMSVVSQYSYLCTGTHDYTHPHMPLTWKPITIGSCCWIAAGAFLGPGTTIGDGAVIGARAVVTKDMPPWMVCAGNPCKPLKPRIVRVPVP